MAVGMLMRIPEGTQEMYDGVMEAMEWESRPQPDGWRSLCGTQRGRLVRLRRLGVAGSVRTLR